MKTRIVDVEDIKKTPEARTVEALLKKLEPETAIEITLTGGETSRSMARLCRYVANSLRQPVRTKTMWNGTELLVYLKGESG